MPDQPAPKYRRPERVPAKVAFIARGYPEGGDNVLGARFMHGMRETFALPHDDPWVIAGALAGIFYVEELANRAHAAADQVSDDANVITDRELMVITLMCKAAGQHVRMALELLDAIEPIQAENAGDN